MPDRSASPTPPSLWTLAWRQLGRDFRAGELRLLIVAVMLAVGALTAVSFFADRIQSGLARDARALIGGDAIVASDNPTPAALQHQAEADGLLIANTVVFPSMGRADEARGGASKLVAVKAVGGGYPLRGQLRLQDPAGGAERAAAGPPPPGSAWVDPGLLDALNLRVGDVLLLGDASLRVAAAIAAEPDRGAGFMSFSPRVMLNLADLPATGLVQPGSRVTYRLAVAGQGARGDAAVRAFVRRAEAQIAADGVRGVRLESLDSGRPEMQQALDRAGKFLNLVALLAALLAAVAVGIAARDFAGRHLDDCAMLRVLGQSQRRIAGAYTLEFAAVGLIASALGVLLGLAVHFVFVVLLAGLVSSELPPPGVWPAVFGLGVGLVLLLGFGLPPVLQLARVPPLRVIRRDLGEIKAASVGVLVIGALAFAALLLAVAADPKLGLVTVGGFAAAVALFALCAWLAVGVLRRAMEGGWMATRAPRWLVLATRQVAARPAFAVLQVSALSVGLLALVLLVLLRTDLVGSWRRATPPDAPNRFVINVQPEQGAPFQQQLRDGGVRQYDWYPMIRGRLVAINGKPVTPDGYPDERAQRLVDREFNLSHAGQMPSHNEVVAGRWTPEEAGALSIEEGIAKTLGVTLGDTLRFDVGGTQRDGRITSVRKVDWGSMRVNFFVMFPTTELPGDLAVSYIAAFRAPGSAAPDQASAPAPAAQAAAFDNALARNFPNITSVDVSSTIAQVQRVLDQVIRAVEFLFGFTLATGLVVLFAAVTATREQRAREFAVMRALGAGSTLLGRVQRAELLGVGALAGALASVAALVVGWALAKWVFEFAWDPPLWVPLAGAAAGALLALAAGWWGLREVLRRPVVETLRQAVQ